jgi:hypothetical protein
MTPIQTTATLLAVLAFAACSRSPEPASAPQAVAPTAPATASTDDVRPADLFMAHLHGICGQAFAGRVVANQPEQPEDPFTGKPLVMHVRECGAIEIRVPFHVGDDHSRTWVLTRTATGLRLKHDHRHPDGSEDAVTLYGGDTAEPGTEQRQEFPVDAESIATFEREGLTASVTNTWAMEIEPGQRFLYELSRPGGRFFQVEFDLSAPVVDTPPAPWGDSD